MSRLPNPSQLVFLSKLPGVERWTKVRFLGWYVTWLWYYRPSAQNVRYSITNYDVPSATLKLDHHYPAESATTVSALVDIRSLVESIETSELQDGSWINVVGYFTGVSAIQTREKRHSKVEKTAKRTVVKIEAVMIWSAGSFRIEDYEKSLQLRQAAVRE